MSDVVNRYLSGSIPIIAAICEPVEEAIKHGKGAKLVIGDKEYAIAKRGDLGYYIKYFCNGNIQKSPLTHRFDIMKNKLMAPLGDYREWRPIE